jgi:hypothetical protein
MIIDTALFNVEGAGKAGHRLMPVARLQQKSRRQSPQVSRTTGLPCAMV